MISAWLLERLACPRCPSRPALRLEQALLICTECGVGYRIEDGIPHLLAEEALSPEEVKEALVVDDRM